MIVSDFIMSDPCFRDIITSSLNPNLASITLIVNRIIVNWGFSIEEYTIIDGIIIIKDSITPSSINKDINRWFW